MKKLLILMLLLVSVLMPSSILVGSAGAVSGVIPECSTAKGKTTDVCKDFRAQGTKTNPIIKIIKVAINVVSYIAGLAAVILIIVSSIRFMTSGGDSAKVAQAKSALAYALVGVAVAALAQAIIGFILNNV